MRIENLCVNRLYGDVAGATTHGHKIAIKGGYIYQTFQGGYTLTPLGWSVVRKIENIIREEMNAIDGQEILMPVVCGADLWIESGRYDKVDVLTKDSIGEELTNIFPNMSIEVNGMKRVYRR